MALFDEILGIKKPTPVFQDPYVDDLEKVDFVINGERRKFVGGSFKGVPFFVSSHELRGGRRLVVQNMPNADANIIQDLGRQTRGVTFDAYQLGKDVFTQKQRLIEAMESTDSGGFVHPYFGQFTARAWNYSVSESKLEKQIVKFSLTFVIIDDSITRKVSGNRDALIKTAVEDSNNSILDDFKRVFDVIDTANHVVDFAAAGIDKALRFVFEARQGLRNVALFTEKIKAIQTNISILLGSPGALGQALLDVVSFNDEDSSDRDFKAEQEESLLASSFLNQTENIVIGSESDIQIQNNDAALNSLISQGSAANAVLLTPSVPFDSTDDASANIDNLLASLDQSQNLALSDSAYYAALELQTQATDYISQISENLRNVETIDLKHVVTVLTLSYELYGNTDGLADIIRRNTIRDPLFVDSDTLDVLTGG